jgi:hypothetical protein
MQSVAVQYVFLRPGSLIPLLVLLAVIAYVFLYLSGNARGANGFGLPVFAALAAILGLVWLVLG